jgi:ribonuclease III
MIIMHNNLLNDMSSPLSALIFNENNKLLTTDELTELMQRYNYNFKIDSINLFRQAMVHKSYCLRKNEAFKEGNADCPDNCLPLQEESNERLEYLGDAVLNLIIGTYLYQRYYDLNEGFLTKLRTKLVNGRMLAKLCTFLNISDWFIISAQVEAGSGRANAKILEDTFEALLGAMYLNSGCNIEPVQRWLINLIEDTIDIADLIISNENYKDQIIKTYQQSFGYIPKFYDYSTDIVDNNKVYTVCLKDRNGQIIQKGSSNSKKNAENECARLCLLNM